MSTKDITKEQMDTLVLIRSLEEFITDEHENLSKLDEVIWTLEESLSTEEHKKLVADICKLTEKGYLLSDATEEHIIDEQIPDVEGITPKGKYALDEWEQQFKESIKNEKESTNITVSNYINNYSLFDSITINVSLLGGKSSLFKVLADTIKGIAGLIN